MNNNELSDSTENQSSEGPVNCTASELSTYLQALAEGYLPTSCSDTSQSVPSKSMSIASRSYQRGRRMVFFRGFPSLQMSQNSMGDRGMESQTLCAGDSPAKTFPAAEIPAVEKGLGWTGKEVDFGKKWRGLSLKFNPATSWWKTHHCLFQEDLPQSSLTLPQWGLMLGGELWEPAMSVRPTSANGFGLLDTTPTKVMPVERELPPERIIVQANGKPRKISKKGKSGSMNWAQSMLHKGLIPTPELCEYYMGWPIGTTGLRPLETGKFQEWLQRHGGA
ncbi:MAG: hypothetical protein PHX60_06940 [Giesbergeria sp.]|nr:hypothetical protein [Giesbergeria sp.]MDD2609421.1 hypothetical protein [Giesbergeria sp.]